jgi:hypothetical protein
MPLGQKAKENLRQSFIAQKMFQVDENFLIVTLFGEGCDSRPGTLRPAGFEATGDDTLPH